MTTYTSTRKIAAPVNLVFDTVSQITNFSEAIPQIVNVEFLSEQKSGLGTRFKETRLMNGREATTELEVTEFVPNERIRLVSDAGGTIWDTVFTVQPAGDQVELDMVMNASAYKFTSRIMNIFIKGFVQRALEQDMDAVKEYCEQKN